MQFVWPLWALLEVGQEFGVKHPFKTIFPSGAGAGPHQTATKLSLNSF